MTAPAAEALITRAAELIRTEGRPLVADDLLRKTAATRSVLPVVVVAGEDKRGKSSLVNALVGRPELSPVGVEAVTGVPVTLFNAYPERAALLRYGEKVPVATEFETARRLATVQGNPQNQENIRAVRLGIRCQLLEKIMIIDTPGVGGLQSGHAELTLQSLQFADALMFVIEAGAQFRAAELAFLRRASARIDTVILVLTKIDLHRGWRTIVRDNLAILQEQAPRFATCPVVPVSSLLCLLGLQSDDPEEAKALRNESGMAELEGVLVERVADRAAVLDDVNLLRETLWPLAIADRAIGEQLAALATGGTARAALEAEQQRLAELSDERAEWPRQLELEIRKLTLQRSEDVAIGLAEIRRRYEERLKEPTKQDKESLPGELVADLTALAGRLNEEAAKRLSGLVERMLDDIDSASELRESIQRATEGGLERQLGTLTLGTYSMNHYDKLSIVSSFSSGRSLSTLISGGGLGLTAGTLICPPVGIAIGLGLGAFYAFQSFKGRGRALFSAEFKGWMTEQCLQTQVTVNTTFQREVIDLQEEMRRAVRDALAERERQIAASLRASKELLAIEESERGAAQQRLNDRLRAIRESQREILELLGALAITESLGESDSPSAPVGQPPVAQP